LRKKSESKDYLSGLFEHTKVEVSQGALSGAMRMKSTYSDSPNRFVSDDDILPVLLFDDLGKSLDLTTDNLVRLISLTFFKGLSDTEDDLYVLLESGLSLLGDKLIGFVEKSTTFGVTKDDPFESDILELSEAAHEKGRT
jgi:hypothetical protein